MASSHLDGTIRQDPWSSAHTRLPDVIFPNSSSKHSSHLAVMTGQTYPGRRATLPKLSNSGSNRDW